jgi:hypothetical protein
MIFRLFFLISFITLLSQPSIWSQSIHIKHPVDSAALSQKTNSSADTIKTIAYYDAFIHAIEIKIQTVQAHPESHQKALNSGWYSQINSELQKAKEEREQLINE